MFDDRRSSLSGYDRVPSGPVDSPPTDGFAIASLLCAVPGLIPFGLFFGILALTRITRTRQSGRGLAIGGIAVSVLWLGVGLAAIIPKAAHPARTAAPASGEVVSAYELAVSECFDSAGYTTKVTHVSCDGPHDEEIHGRSEASAKPGPYPGVPDLYDTAMADCGRQAKIHLEGITAPPGLTSWAHLPSPDDWEAGTRGAICTYKLESGKLTAPVGGR